MSNAMSQMIGLKEKGLPRIARLLQSNSSDVVRSGASLLSNMSRHPVLHKTMGKQFPLHWIPEQYLVSTFLTSAHLAL